MITVTARAVEELESIAQLQITDTEEALMFIPAGPARLGLTVAKPKERDQVIERGGVKVLSVAAEASDVINGLVLDCRETPEGRRFIIGESFPEA